MLRLHNSVRYDKAALYLANGKISRNSAFRKVKNETNNLENNGLTATENGAVNFWDDQEIEGKDIIRFHTIQLLRDG
jgi:hypothetical protein